MLRYLEFSSRRWIRDASAREEVLFGRNLGGEGDWTFTPNVSAFRVNEKRWTTMAGRGGGNATARKREV